MKKITAFFLPRYTWFVLWFRQWFRNPNGVSGFANQVMNWFIQKIMPIAVKLNKQNQKATESIKSLKASLQKWYQHATVDADEWDEVRSTVRMQGFWLTVGTIAEAALNYFGVSAVIVAKGLGWVALNALIAVVLTGFGIYIFKRWFAALLNKPMYKQLEAKKRNYLELVLISILCVLYEAVIFYLCKIRGVALEGSSGAYYVTYFITLAGMLIPLIAGYLSYERSRFLSAYHNTLRIAKSETKIRQLQTLIMNNNEQMTNYFSTKVQDKWALVQEFKVYKENRNAKNKMPDENVSGHFCASFAAFEQVAKQRYLNELAQHKVYYADLKPSLN